MKILITVRHKTRKPTNLRLSYIHTCMVVCAHALNTTHINPDSILSSKFTLHDRSKTFACKQCPVIALLDYKVVLNVQIAYGINTPAFSHVTSYSFTTAKHTCFLYLYIYTCARERAKDVEEKDALLFDSNVSVTTSLNLRPPRLQLRLVTRYANKRRG